MREPRPWCRMSWLRRLFRRDSGLSEEEKARRGRALEGKRKHLRGLLSRTQNELRACWTDYRNTQDFAKRRNLKQRIRRLEAERRRHTKDMVRLRSEMTKLGYREKAGYVDIH